MLSSTRGRRRRPSRARHCGVPLENGAACRLDAVAAAQLAGQLIDAGPPSLVVHPELLELSGELVARCCPHCQKLASTHRDLPAQRSQLDTVTERVAEPAGHDRSSSQSPRRARRASARARRPASVMV
jgi:hypothetical protein